MSDLISRQDALNCISKIYSGHTACNMFEALDVAAEYIEDLPSANQWIPCSERLPEKDGIYWITAEVDGIRIVVTCIFYDGKWGAAKTNVLAWLTIIEPEPWKGEQND